MLWMTVNVSEAMLVKFRSANSVPSTEALAARGKMGGHWTPSVALNSSMGDLSGGECLKSASRQRVQKSKNQGECRELNPGPLAPEARIIPLDHTPAA